MDIIVLILIVFFAVSVMIVARVIINKRKKEKRRQEEERKRLEEERRRKEEEEHMLVEEKGRGEEEERKRLEEERRRKEEELRLAEERRRREEEEHKRLEEERRLAEEKKHREEDERKRLEEEQRKKEEKERIPPGKRGGRSWGPGQLGIKQPSEPESSSLKPEIICWNEGWKWIVGIEVSEEFESLSITQNGEVLEQDNSEKVRYPLHYIEGTVKVAWTEGEKDIPIMKEGRNYLIFKMRRKWKGLGRLVNRPTSGYYLAIVPEEWKRDEEMSGGAPVAPENVQLDGYKAHFFDLRQNEDIPIAFIDANGERIQVESGSSRFQLVGNEIFDSSDDMGSLFGEEPPCIKTIDEQEWGNVGMIVVGEEGSGRNRWRMQFSSQKGNKEQRMPDELTNRRGGWYFVRIYDNDDNLLESMDFRFIVGLKDIQIMKSECLPDPHGYNDVTVQFVHQAICKVEPANGEMHHALTIRRENGLTILTVPPKPDYDKTHWILRNGDAETKVTVLVERIWWTFGKIELAPVDWTDKPITLARRDFAATSDKALWVKFPRTRWISEIDVGFNRTKSRSYNVEVEKKEITIPLRDFCDVGEIQNPTPECLFQLFIDSQFKTYSVPLLVIRTDFCCKKCKFVTNSEEEVLPHMNIHLSEFIPHLSYEELYQRFSGFLPFQIYQCNYCNFYVSADVLENPTSTIFLHQEHNCQKVEREFGLVKIRFRVVSDPDEIRENVIADLPHIYQCQICGKEFQGDDRELRLNHLHQHRKDEIFDIL